jgi:hypothetical protein
MREGERGRAKSGQNYPEAARQKSEVGEERQRICCVETVHPDPLTPFLNKLESLVPLFKIENRLMPADRLGLVKTGYYYEEAN